MPDVRFGPPALDRQPPLGKRYVLGHGGEGWAIWPQRPFENPDGSGKTVDKFSVIASYPYGQRGWEEAWRKFLELEPRYPLRRSWSRMTPWIGITVFWAVALGLLTAAIAAEGIVALVISVGLGLYLLLFLVLALGESLPWNE